MGPDIDLIRRSEIREKLNMVGGRVAHRPEKHQTNVWDWSGSGLGVFGTPLGIRNAYMFGKLLFLYIFKNCICFFTVSYSIYIYIYRSEGDAERDISSLGAMG